MVVRIVRELPDKNGLSATDLTRREGALGGWRAAWRGVSRGYCQKLAGKVAGFAGV